MKKLSKILVLTLLIMTVSTGSLAYAGQKAPKTVFPVTAASDTGIKVAMGKIGDAKRARLMEIAVYNVMQAVNNAGRSVNHK